MRGRVTDDGMMIMMQVTLEASTLATVAAHHLEIRASAAPLSWSAVRSHRRHCLPDGERPHRVKVHADSWRAHHWPHNIRDQWIRERRRPGGKSRGEAASSTRGSARAYASAGKYSHPWTTTTLRKPIDAQKYLIQSHLYARLGRSCLKHEQARHDNVTE